MAAVKETLLTAEGLKKLEQELAHYKSVRRIEVAERIKIAIEYGDISENSEYDDAKNEQAFIEGHISELENKINTAKIIDEAVKNGIKYLWFQPGTWDDEVIKKALDNNLNIVYGHCVYAILGMEE